jgi:hypothetical protein
MILPKEYLMGRDRDYPLDVRQALNMAELLVRVNALLSAIGEKARVSSGYRPSAINKTIGGAKMSTHTMCAGVDLVGQKIGMFLKANIAILEEYDLFLENPDFTPKWTHLDIKQRKNRIFNP